MVEFLVPFLLCALALALLVAEDVLPTGGTLGVLAACCLGFVLYLGFVESAWRGWAYLAAEAVLVPSGFAASGLVMARTGIGRAAYLAPPESHEVDAGPGRLELGRLVGLRGRALTALRPSGMVDFEGKRLDGVAEEGLIAAGSPVVATEVRSGRLVVRVAAESDSTRVD